MQLRENRLLLSPSDLNNFLACRRRTALDLQLAHGEIELERIPRPDAELVAERGREHEREYRQQLEDEGRQLVEIDTEHGITNAAVATERAMRDGADVIFQAAFLDPEGWQGYADFLVRTKTPSDLGPWSYEAYDTKLATHPKPYFVLQLAFYSEQIARLQGWMPEQMHVVLGTKKVESFRYDDFSAYLRRIRRAFLASLAAGAAAPYPYPVEHCDYCDWWRECRDKRRADDHTSLVAGLARPQSIKLEEGGVPTVRALATLDEGTKVSRLAAATLTGLHHQARLQIHTRDTKQRVREFLPLEHRHGFLRLPAQSGGDVFFDIEGDPYWGREGLEYLLGAWVVDDDGAGYRAEWAHDEREERAAFERWIDWLMNRRRRWPGLHVYHYNHYEPTALKRLMGKYGTREKEIDELLTAKVFVDLYAVVRQAMRIGEESYGLKYVERFYDFRRDAAVTEAGGSILAYQEWLESRQQGKLDAIADYNADDCRSTWALREWLLEQRREAELEFDTILPDRDEVPPRERSEKSLALEAEVKRLQAELRAGLDPEDRTLGADDRARVLLADLLDYHRRENKPGWWAYFDRQTRSLDELRDEDSESLADLEPAPDLPWGEEKQSWLIPLRFPHQQHKIGPGTAEDPATEATWNVHRIDEVAHLVWLKRGKRAAERPLPRALASTQPLQHVEQQAALRRLAERVLAHGFAPGEPLDASCDVLLRRPPRIAGHASGAPLQEGRVDLERLGRQVLALESSALFVQGPPGSGKTFTGARVIAELLRQGKRVGVTATAHKAIHNVLEELEEAAAECGLDFVGWKKCSGDPETEWESAHIESRGENEDFEDLPDEVRLVAGTAWLFAREKMAGSCDVLVVDEAGQVALADALATSQAARSVVLLGDPQQLAHVSQGTHPRESGVSVLEHLLAGRATVPPEEGVFLASTYRMHPDVCEFISQVMYDGRLASEAACAEQRIMSDGPLAGTGLRFLGVEHEGNRQNAPEEAACIAAEVDRLLAGGRVRADDRPERALTLDDILVVAPYNAQVRCLREHLPPGARVGTVDKFQGQEAPIVFFSMTSSTGEDVPRGMDFLFSRNRLNVAVSRARCVAVVVASPPLLTTVCNSVEQLKLVNALCRFAEMAEEA